MQNQEVPDFLANASSSVSSAGVFGSTEAKRFISDLSRDSGIDDVGSNLLDWTTLKYKHQMMLDLWYDERRRQATDQEINMWHGLLEVPSEDIRAYLFQLFLKEQGNQKTRGFVKTAESPFQGSYSASGLSHESVNTYPDQLHSLPINMHNYDNTTQSPLGFLTNQNSFEPLGNSQNILDSQSLYTNDTLSSEMDAFLVTLDQDMSLPDDRFDSQVWNFQDSSGEQSSEMLRLQRDQESSVAIRASDHYIPAMIDEPGRPSTAKVWKTPSISTAIEDDRARRLAKRCGSRQNIRSQKGRFECTLQCTQRFPSICDLMRHEETVFPQEYYICTGCSALGQTTTYSLFTRQDKLNEHIRKVHGNSKIKAADCRVPEVPSVFPRECALCPGKTFHEWEARRAHILWHYKKGHTIRKFFSLPHPMQTYSGVDRSVREKENGIQDHNSEDEDDEDEDDKEDDDPGERNEEDEESDEDEDDESDEIDGDDEDDEIDGNDEDDKDNDDARGQGQDDDDDDDDDDGNDDDSDGSQHAQNPAPDNERSSANENGSHDAMADFSTFNTYNPWSYRTNVNLHQLISNNPRVVPYTIVWGDAATQKGGTATIYRVMIQTETDTSGFSEDGRAVVKKYRHEKRHIFEAELEGLSLMDSNRNIVRCFGWFMLHDSFNLLLEEAHGNLYEYFADTNPPISSREIRQFYSKLSATSNALQHVHDKRFGRHGDLKPENILWYRSKCDSGSLGALKIADFGYSQFSSLWASKSSRARNGCTPLYSAPEIWQPAYGRESVDMLQRSDIWSFGCILSLAASYVVGGFSSIREFEGRLQASCTRRRLTKVAFHDGVQVLKEVTSWHEHLRKHRSSYDDITSSILDLVDDHLLQAEPTQRFNAKQLNQSLGTILDNATPNAIAYSSTRSKTSTALSLTGHNHVECVAESIIILDYLKYEVLSPATQNISERAYSLSSNFTFGKYAIENAGACHDKCAGPGVRPALMGLGGLGKTKLAIEYAYSLRNASAQTYVLWVPASTRDRFEEAYREIADRLQLLGRHDRKANVLKLVSEWLEDERNGQWLMIVDNADVMETFFPSRKRKQSAADASVQTPLATYLPQSRNGAILVISRSKDVAARLVGGHNKIKEVLAMDENESLQLLRNKLCDPSDGKSAVELVRVLNGIPLAITQAAAYINRRACMTVARYLNEFRRNDKKRESLLNWDAGELCRDESASNSVVTAWQLLFDLIRQERPSAAELLSLMGFFNPQDIPEWILRRYNKQNEEVAELDETCEDEESNNTFDEDLDTLLAYSLVRLTADNDACEMHALVQFYTRVWLTSSGDAEQWEHRFVTLMAQEMPSCHYEQWKKCQQLLPHVEPLFNMKVAADQTLEAWAQVLTNSADYLSVRGSYSIAQELAKKALAAREKALGLNDQYTLDGVMVLAEVLYLQGDYVESETLSRRVFEGRQRKFGMNVATLASLGNLAIALHSQGKREEAEKLYRTVVEEQERKLGAQHPRTLTSVANLALVLQDQEKYEEAEKLNRRALEGCEQKLGVWHPDTLTSVNNLAMVLCYQGRKYGNALQAASHRGHEAMVKLLLDEGAEVNAQGGHYGNALQGKYGEAEKLGRRALDWREQKQGVQHPETLTSVHHLALILYCQEKYDEAEKLSRRELDWREQKLGVQHPDNLTSVHFLALVLHKLRRYTEAAELYQRAHDGLIAQLGFDHRRTAACRNHFSGMLQEMGQNRSSNGEGLS